MATSILGGTTANIGAALPAGMTEEDLKYWYEERSAILHFDGGLPKEKAEALAAAEVETIRRALAKEGKAE